MITQINHIGIAVHSLEEQVPFYRDVLGLNYLGEEIVEDQKVRVAMFKVGEVKIELLEPTDPSSPIAAFLSKKGEGIHHVAFQTDNIEEQLNDLKNKQIRLIDEQPRIGAHQTKIAFIHPKASGKVLMEICQPGGDEK
ncbi:methylmalonyl-CoA epimerase [Caldithrix abyssi DSM 13497]|uniref:Methylmalonyl-CoA epimerase n=1 Tax=Caldithrix abyssi DSM 13497 TaxID=880073 RepID=H1XU42_CALAY|nr:methylmalonyl-CoA epimerase [Caldithrix abyssi]APF16861.1 methylmalonyl-CoA epimerase [Caldithrix abyssi DSM 13497]EHO40485.1 methylmalonyl-CoA epimerase [Caldithrix abyssi DSM 13497]